MYIRMREVTMIRFILKNIALTRQLFERRRRAYVSLVVVIFLVSSGLQALFFSMDSAEVQKQYTAMYTLVHMMNPVILWLGASMPSILSVLYYRVLLVRNPWNVPQALRSFGRAFLLSLAFAVVVLACDVGVKVLLLPLGTSIFFLVSVFSALVKVWLWLYVFSAYIMICANHDLRLRESIHIIKKHQIEMTTYVVFASVLVGFVCLVLTDLVRCILGVFIDMNTMGLAQGLLITFEFILRESIMCVIVAGAYRSLLNKVAVADGR